MARKRVNWLWPGRVPMGKVTLLVGDPGQGKSLLALDVAARVTTGAAWPDQAEPGASGEGQGAGGDGQSAGGGALDPRASALDTPNPVGSVVLMSAEDDVADTIRPRLEVAGGDIQRVTMLRAIGRPEMGAGELMFSLARDVKVLESVIRQLPDVRLVVLDPVSAYLVGADANSNAAIRAVLAPLKSVAEKTGVAVLAISHLTKKADAALLYRTMGSLAFVAAARAVWAVGPDRAPAAAPELAGRRLFLPVKCNLAGGVTGLAYRVVPSADDPEVPILAW
ncbi:MAG TPA: AAA family ATPase, partial [Planctomycetota bacterium]|nr:AAA family ATPase [Planctomycetota bacterium]